MSGRRSAIVLGIFALACSAAPAHLTPYEEGEQVVMAIDACIPFSMAIGTGPLPTNGETMLAVRGTPSALDLEADEVACVLAAGSDCVEVRTCLGIELFPDNRCGTAFFSCEGDVAFECIPGDVSVMRPSVRLRQDCRHEGRVCDAMAVGCHEATCEGPVPVPTCDGNALIVGCGGAASRNECDPGRTCDAGRVACIGAGAPCVRDRCDGDVLTVCDLLTQRIVRTVQCGDIGRHCMSDLAGAHCLPDGSACNQATIAGCFETRVMYCDAGGQFRQYDCVAHGFGPCESPDAFGGRCGPAGRRLF